jgi:hypothetical protein
MSELLRTEVTIRHYNQFIELYERLSIMTRVAIDMSGKVALVTGGGYGMSTQTTSGTGSSPTT